MIKEAFEGPPSPFKESYFTETASDTGIFGTLEKQTAETASQSIHGTTLAAHADHTRYHMWGINECLETNVFPKMDWRKSWQIKSVTEEEWQHIQTELREEYARLVHTIESVDTWNEQFTNEVVSSLAHSAYHLGAMKQMIKSVST